MQEPQVERLSFLHQAQAPGGPNNDPPFYLSNGISSSKEFRRYLRIVSQLLSLTASLQPRLNAASVGLRKVKEISNTKI